MFIFWLFVLVSEAYSQSNCTRMCANISVPYPFGIKHTSDGGVNSSCALNPYFLFLCNNTFKPPRLFFREVMPIRTISIEEGTLSVKIEIAFNTPPDSPYNPKINLGDGPFRFSDTRNKLTAIGCDIIAVIQDSEQTFGSGCISLCEVPSLTPSNSCSGLGCCQTSVPKSLNNFTVDIISLRNHSNAKPFETYEYAFIADQRTFNVSDWNHPTKPFAAATGEMLHSEAVIEWVAKEQTCQEAQAGSDYVCGSNTNCSYSDNGMGYRCVCKDGFAGNPYFHEGCHDIDECKNPSQYPCKGTCKNTVGSHTCKCPLGMHGDGKTGYCGGLGIAAIASAIGAGLLFLVIVILACILYKRRLKEQYFYQNGGVLLENQNVRIFTESQLLKATNNFDQLLGQGGFGAVCKGVLPDGTLIAVKKPKVDTRAQAKEEYQNEIAIVSLANHRNVVQILGLCLETRVPLVVYEYISNGSLSHQIHLPPPDNALLGWDNRLRIAEEIALALEYLHSLVTPPIIHGDVKSANILLDDTFTAKVADFGASVIVSPRNHDIARKVQGTFGYLDPEYLMIGDLTYKSDVYSYGVVLVELMTGEKPINAAKKNIAQCFISAVEDHTVHDVLCFDLENEAQMDEIQAFGELVKRCLEQAGARRPTMREVAIEMRRLRSLKDPLGKRKIDERSELGEPSYGKDDDDDDYDDADTNVMLRSQGSNVKCFSIDSV